MMTTLTVEMPTTYLPPLGTPLYWRNETTGVLSAAVWAYLSHGADPERHPSPTATQLVLLIAYLHYVIHAPCWYGQGELAQLRADVADLQTLADVQSWIMRCLAIGVDPL